MFRDIESIEKLQDPYPLLSGRSGVRIPPGTREKKRDFVSRSASILAKRTSAFFVFRIIIGGYHQNRC